MGRKENLLVAWTFWMALSTGGGMINGWDYLTQKMDQEIDGRGQLWQLCDHGPSESIISTGTNCKKRDEFYADVYNIAIGGMSAANLFFGLLMDARLPLCGPKMAVLTGLLLLVLGNYFIGSVDSNTQSVDDIKIRMYLGALCIGTGPVGPFLTAMPMVNYSTLSRVTLTAAINGVFYLSGMTYLAGFQLVEAAKVPVEHQRQLFSGILIILTMFNALVSWLIWPTSPVLEGAKCHRLVDPALWRLPSSESVAKSDLTEALVVEVEKPQGLELLDENADGDELPLRQRGLCGQVKTLQYLFLIVYLSYFQLSQSFYMGNASVLLVPHKSWTNLLLMIQVNITPMFYMAGVAWIISNIGYGFSLCVTVMCSSGMFAILLIPNHGTAGNVISTCLLALEMTMLYTFIFTYIGGYFGYRFYGKLVGFIFLTTSIVGQLNFALIPVPHAASVIFALVPLLFLPLGMTTRGRAIIAPPGYVAESTAHTSSETEPNEIEHEVPRKRGQTDWLLANEFREYEVSKARSTTGAIKSHVNRILGPPRKIDP